MGLRARFQAGTPVLRLLAVFSGLELPAIPDGYCGLVGRTNPQAPALTPKLHRKIEWSRRVGFALQDETAHETIQSWQSKNGFGNFV